MFENTRDGVMMVDTNLRIVHVNAAFSEITGYSNDTKTRIIFQFAY
jgi:PAS domain S-box-containing protein